MVSTIQLRRICIQNHILTKFELRGAKLHFTQFSGAAQSKNCSLDDKSGKISENDLRKAH